MKVYRDGHRFEQVEVQLVRLDRLARDGAAMALLVELGELEQGILDATHPTADGWSELERDLRLTSLTAGAAFVADWSGRSASFNLTHARRLIGALRAHELPALVAVKPPEGYVHYALDPGGYAAAARAYVAAVGPRQARRSVVVGVRSIGTSLSAVVAATVGSERSLTIRPRGEAGERHVVADRDLCSLLVDWTTARDVLVVDEGPGATGETFAAVAGWLRSLGVPHDRIVLFPSRGWGLEFAPVERRHWFEAARKFPPPNGDGLAVRAAARLGLGELVDISAGQWRAAVPGAASAPAGVGHERRKYLALDAGGHRVMLRFAGMGRWGAASFERLTALAAAGAGPEPIGCADGFLAYRWVDGRPVSRSVVSRAVSLPMSARLIFLPIESPPDSTLAAGRPAGSRSSSGRSADGTGSPAEAARAAASPDGVAQRRGIASRTGPSDRGCSPSAYQPARADFHLAIAEYLSRRIGLFQTGQPVDLAPLHSMLVENAPEALGADPPGLAKIVALLERLPEREAVVSDARLQPWEWLRTATGYVKTDAVDHGDGVRLPGPTDPAWDLAAAAVEYQPPESTVSCLVERCASALRQSERDLAAATALYRPIYAAAALGDVTLAAREAADHEDRRRFEHESRRYATALADALHRFA
ncbi:MAG: hypothetical protein HY329_17945 [Chloroflexi bacterium]|nr:hypothetical protein [Chloroflexota bacterium]